MSGASTADHALNPSSAPQCGTQGALPGFLVNKMEMMAPLTHGCGKTCEVTELVCESSGLRAGGSQVREQPRRGAAPSVGHLPAWPEAPL